MICGTGPRHSLYPALLLFWHSLAALALIKHLDWELPYAKASALKKTKRPFKIALPKMKYLGINLTNEVRDLYAENYKTFIKEIKEDSKK